MSDLSGTDLWRGLEELPLRSRQHLRLPVSRMPDGSTLSIAVNALVGTSHRPALLAVAGVHGDEHEGPTALVDVWEDLDPDAARGSLIAVPVLNAPAFRAGSRSSAEDLVDINRIFPGSADGTVTHRIAHTFCEEVVSQADFVLSMHGWSAGYLVEPYVEFQVSGRAAAASWRGALAFGLSILNPLDAGPGRLLSETARRGLAQIEVEIGGQGSSVPERRRLYERGTRNLMRHLGILEGPTPPSGPPPTYVGRQECFAPTGGLTRPQVSVGERVAEGQPLATVYDLNLRPLAVVCSPCAGLVGVLRLSASTLPGQLLATIFPPAGWRGPAGASPA